MNFSDMVACFQGNYKVICKFHKLGSHPERRQLRFSNILNCMHPYYQHFHHYLYFQSILPLASNFELYWLIFSWCYVFLFLIFFWLTSHLLKQLQLIPISRELFYNSFVYFFSFLSIYYFIFFQKWILELKLTPYLKSFNLIIENFKNKKIFISSCIIFKTNLNRKEQNIINFNISN